jgi:hypothetical protein
MAATTMNVVAALDPHHAILGDLDHHRAIPGDLVLRLVIVDSILIMMTVLAAVASRIILRRRLIVAVFVVPAAPACLRQTAPRLRRPCYTWLLKKSRKRN